MQTKAPPKIGRPYGDITTLSATAAKDLEFSNARLEMVLAIDNKGNTQVFRHSESKANISLGSSLMMKKSQKTCPPGFVEVCWTDESGNKVCVCIPWWRKVKR